MPNVSYEKIESIFEQKLREAIQQAYSGPQCRRDYMQNLAILGDIRKNLQNTWRYQAILGNTGQY